MKDIHFIIGIWRSGTTLLREILGMNEAVKIFPEHLVLLNHLKESQKFNQQNKQRMLRNILNNPDFIYFAQPNLDALKDDFAKSNSFREAILATYSSCIEAEKQIDVFIDKNPIYSYYLPQMLSLFPEAKFIWLVREPKDNAISRLKHQIQHLKNYSYLTYWWNYTNREITKAAIQYPERFLLVPYDDLVKKPQQWIEDICHFLNIDFLPNMLAFETKKEERQTQFVLAAKARDGELSEAYKRRKEAMWENLQKPINTTKTEQWKKELSDKQIRQIDDLSLNYYQALLAGDYTFEPPKNFILDSLLKMSLGKLKWDIARKKLL